MDDNNNDDLRPWELIPEDYDNNPTCWDVIGTPVIEEAKRWARHISQGLPYRTSYEARMRHFLALCARSNLRGTPVQLVVAFRCGYWAAAGDPVAMPQQELAAAIGIRKQTLGRLQRLATAAWRGIEWDDSARVYEIGHLAAPIVNIQPGSDESGTHTDTGRSENTSCGMADPLADFRAFGASSVGAA